MENKKLLPIGTVCKLKNSKNSALMIIGFLVRKAENGIEGKTYDYLACAYPFGLFDQNKNFMFDNEDIEEIWHEGFVNEQEKDFKLKLEDVLKNNII